MWIVRITRAFFFTYLSIYSHFFIIAVSINHNEIIIMSSTAVSTFSKNDLFFHMLTFLDPDEAACTGHVCKSWNDMSNDPSVWSAQYETQKIPFPSTPAVKEFFRDFDINRLKYVKKSSSAFGEVFTGTRILTIITEYEGRSEIYKAEFAKSKIFGTKDWETYFGVKVVDPFPRPKNIHHILQGPCPFGRGKIRDSHILVMRPEKVIELRDKEQRVREFSIELINNLSADRNGPRLIDSDQLISKQQYKASMGEACWLLITRDFVPQIDGNFNTDEEYVKSHSGYDIPSGPDTFCTYMAYHAKYKEYLHKSGEGVAVTSSKFTEGRNPIRGSRWVFSLHWSNSLSLKPSVFIFSEFKRSDAVRKFVKKIKDEEKQD